MGVEQRTQGATFRVSGDTVLLYGQREDADGNVTKEYLAVRVDEHGRLMNYDHPDPLNVKVFTDQTLDDDPTEVNSVDNGIQSAIDCSTYRRFSLEVNVNDTLAPTSIEFFVEFSSDGGTTWAVHPQGLFASLIYTTAAMPRHEVFSGEVVQDLCRLRALAVGSSATDFFTFDATLRFWR